MCHSSDWPGTPEMHCQSQPPWHDTTAPRGRTTVCSPAWDQHVCTRVLADVPTQIIVIMLDTSHSLPEHTIAISSCEATLATTRRWMDAKSISWLSTLWLVYHDILPHNWHTNHTDKSCLICKPTSCVQSRSLRPNLKRLWQRHRRQVLRGWWELKCYHRKRSTSNTIQ